MNLTASQAREAELEGRGRPRGEEWPEPRAGVVRPALRRETPAPCVWVVSPSRTRGCAAAYGASEPNNSRSAEASGHGRVGQVRVAPPEDQPRRVLTGPPVARPYALTLEVLVGSVRVPPRDRGGAAGRRLGCVPETPFAFGTLALMAWRAACSFVFKRRA